MEDEHREVTQCLICEALAGGMLQALARGVSHPTAAEICAPRGLPDTALEEHFESPDACLAWALVAHAESVAMAVEEQPSLEAALQVLVTDRPEAPSCARLWLQARSTQNRDVLVRCSIAQRTVASALSTHAPEAATLLTVELIVGALLWSMDDGTAPTGEAVDRALMLAG